MKISKIIIICALLSSCGSIVNEKNSRKETFHREAEQMKEELYFFHELQNLMAVEYAKFPWQCLLKRHEKSSSLIVSVEFRKLNLKPNHLGWVNISFEEKTNLLLGECITPVYSVGSRKLIGYIVGKYRLDQSRDSFSKLKKAYIVDAENEVVFDPSNVAKKKERKKHTFRESFRNTDGWRLSY